MLAIGLDPVPLGLAGALTVAAIVGLGIFVYPWLLRRRGGSAWIAVATIALLALFYLFDLQRGRSAALSLALAVFLALAPLLAGLLVHKLGGKQAR